MRAKNIFSRTSVSRRTGNKTDIVYTWVDGDHPEFRKNIEYWKEKLKYRNIENMPRWKDYGELKYSLRSLEKYIPWANRIFIVHDDCQVPEWIDTGNPGVVLIKHSDIIPEKYLPTYNSAVIESFLHKIPSLSENFIYSNDDCYYLCGIPESFFIENNKPKAFMQNRESFYGKIDNTQPGWYSGIKNANRLLDTIKKEEHRKLIAHTHAACSKKTFYLAWELFEKELDVNCREKFRNTEMVGTINHLFPYLAIYYRYKNVGKSPKIINRVMGKKGLWLRLWNSKNILLGEKTAGYVHSDDTEKIQKHFEMLFPKKSSFEK